MPPEQPHTLNISWLDEPLRLDLVPGGYCRWKPLFSRLLAVLLLVPGLPLILALVVLVRLTSRGPGIIHQTRAGRCGKLFVMHKIRTMVHDAERATGPTWTIKDDPRITRLGRVLRKVHLDELPQLFNVLKGEMVLIGPRPERPEIISALTNHIDGYANRLVVPPGITGLAQINLPPDTDLASVRRKLMLDLEYIKHAQLGLDLRILFCSCLRLLGVPGEHAMRLTFVKRNAGLALDDPAPSSRLVLDADYSISFSDAGEEISTSLRPDAPTQRPS